MKFVPPFNKSTLFIAFHKPFDIETEDGRILERKRRIALTAFTSTILKVLTMSVPLITLKITYDYLNVEVYGLWSAIATFFALFAFSDLGLGNGLQTKLSQAYGKDNLELCRKIISNTFIILFFIACCLLILFLFLFNFIDWATLMNAQSNETIIIASSIVFVIVIPKIINIPISIIERTQLALQEGFKSDIWNIFGYILNLISIVAIAYFDFGKITLLAFTSFLPLIVSALNMFVYFTFQKKELKLSLKLFDLKLSKNLLSLGVLFSILSILSTAGLSMDTFIVARTCNLNEAASYSIIYRVVAIFSAVVAVLSAPLWGANGEAIARGDIKWVEQNTKKMSLYMTSISVILVILGLLLAKFIFKIWLGTNFEFSYLALLWLSILQILFSFISPYFMVLNALGEVRKQIVLFAIYTPIVFGLKYYFSLKYGVAVIPFLGMILYLLIIVIGTYFFAIQSFKKLKSGKL
ncbi:MAG TPA: oligosaccharide flippase family protein [Edaphocola sp.]|nr:oligosaccharide flippase family protein [Edaphocola sp.]